MRLRYLLLLAGTLGSGSLTAQTPDLATAPDSIARARNAIIFLLPHDGTYAINHQPVASSDLAAQFRAIFEPRPSRVLLVAWAPERDSTDVQQVVRLAESQGVTVFRAPFRPGRFR